MEASTRQEAPIRYLLSGNEAVALGCREAGVHLGAGYPGTPSTEILETLARLVPEMYVQWSPNEKVGLEVAAGAALTGARAISTQKHVGLNVAADPLMTLSYMGVEAGLVVVTADDPELHSSQNEQDNRHYARFAKIPMLEPSCSQEAKDYVAAGMEISERFDTPVLLRMTTRISHSKGIVEAGELRSVAVKGFRKDARKYVMVPANARARHAFVEERLDRLRAFAEETELNRVEWGDRRVGVVAAGVGYVQARELLPEASYYKLGLGWPLPLEGIRRFAAEVERLIVIEELDPFIEEQLLAAGIACEGKSLTGLLGELTPGRLGKGLAAAGLLDTAPAPAGAAATVLPRPPVLCPGCPHRSLFWGVKPKKGNVFGDIGCYTLAALPPLQTIDTCLDMGASIGTAIGSSKVATDGKPIFAAIGDSTFLHSGMTGLLDAVYNDADITVLILDNRVTAMTGGQEHPATGKTLMGKAARQVDLPSLVKALGVEHVQVVANHDQAAVKAAVDAAVAHAGPSVVIARAPCALMPVKIREIPYRVDPERCVGCRTCLRTGCPALSLTGGLTAKGLRQVVIDEDACTGCSLCFQVCPHEAIRLTSEEVPA